MLQKSLKTVKQQLLRSHFLVAISIFTITVASFSVYAFYLLSEHVNESNMAQLNAVVNQVELEVGRMDTVLLNILYSSVVKDNYDAIGIDPKKNQEIMDAMTSINGPRLEVQQINAYTLNGRAVSAGFNNRMMDLDISGEEWFDPVLKMDGKRYIHVPQIGDDTKMIANQGRQRYISILRIFYDKYNQKSGIVEVMRDVRYVFRSLKDQVEMGKSRESVSVFMPEGNLIYSQRENFLSEPDIKLLIERQKTVASDSFRFITDNEPHRVHMQISAETGWIFVMSIPESEIYKPIYHLLWIAALLSAFIILLIFFISNTVAKRIAGPIKQLHVRVSSTKLHNMTETSWKISGGTVEVDELARGFRQMTKQLSCSIEETLEANKQESQARMIALQAQMNPHFIYNSLTNISVMAENGMDDGIVEMCSKISFMLRYASSSSNSVVSMRDELNYVKNYLDCMCIRYGKYLYYEINVEPGTADLQIFKLAVQPLVENAIHHGVGEDSCWRIIIKSYLVENDGWRISVRNDGTCFNEKNLQELHLRMKELESNGNYPQFSIKGMGLLNLYSRLKLFFNAKAFFEIRSDCKTVEIIIGKKTNDSEEDCND